MLTAALGFSMIFSSVSAFAQFGGGGGFGGGGFGGGGFGGPAAKPQQGTLEITVVGPSGAPERDVTVAIFQIITGNSRGAGAQQPNTKKNIHKKTNAAGVAKFSKINYSRYNIVGHKDGFAPAFEESVNLNGKSASATIKLTPGVDRKIYLEDPALARKAQELLDQGVKSLESGKTGEAEKYILEALEIKPTGPDILYQYGIVQADQEKYDLATESFTKAKDRANFMLTTLPPAAPKQNFGGFPGGPGGFPGGPGGAPSGPGGTPAKTGGSTPAKTGGSTPAKTGGGGPGGFGGGMMGGPGGAFGNFGGGGNNSAGNLREVYENIVKNAEKQIALIPARKARNASIANRFDEAIALYDEAIKSNPQDSGIYVEKASTLINAAIGAAEKKDEELAKKYVAAANTTVDKALEIDPDDPLALKLRESLRNAAESGTRMTANAVSKAAEDGVKQLKSLMNEGDKLLKSDASAAIEKYENANTLVDGKLPEIWLRIGLARAELKQDTGAIAALIKAVELAPPNQVETYNKALVDYYVGTNRINEAVDFIASSASNPESRLMDIFDENKNATGAAADLATTALERVVKLNPSNMDAIFELGVSYYFDKKYSQSRDMLNKYVENGKDDKKVKDAKDFLAGIARQKK